MTSGSSRGTALRRLAKNASALALGGAIAQGALILVEVLIARRLDQAAYGIFSTVYVISLTSLYFIDLGMTWKLIQNGSRDHAEIAPLLGTTLALKALAFSVVYPAVLIGLQWVGYDELTVGFFRLFFIYALILAVQDSLGGVYAARQEMVVNALFQGATPIVVCILALAFTLREADLDSVAMAYILGGACVSSIWAWRTFRLERPRIAFRRSLAILRGGYLYGLTGMLSVVFFKASVLLMSLLCSMSEVGLFAAGYKLLDLGYKIPTLVTRVVAPMLFRQSLDDRPAYALACDILLRATTVTGLCMSILCFLVAEPLIGFIFGARYEASALVLKILAPCFALRFVTNTLETILTTSDLHQRRTALLAVTTLLALLLNGLLITAYGSVGAALTAMLGDLSLLILYAKSQTLMDVPNILRTIAWPVLIASAILAAVTIWRTSAPLQAIAAIALFLSCLLLTNYITQGELKTVWTNLKRPSAEVG